MTNKTINDEVNLSDLFVIIWNGKFKILFIIVAVVSFVFVKSHYNNQNIKFLANTKIVPISTFEESNYQIYNSYLKTIYEDNLFKTKKYLYDKNKDEEIKDVEEFTIRNIEVFKLIGGTSFEFINKEYLNNLFMDILSEKKIFRIAIKKFNLLKEEDYLNSKAYNDAVLKLSNSIQIVKSPKNLEINQEEKNLSWDINFNIDDKKIWEDILQFVEKSVNQQVNDYLKTNFFKLIANEKKLIQYTIDDIESSIKNTSLNYDKKYYSELKKMVNSNQTVSRLQDMFESTPIIDMQNFKASEIRYKLTTYEQNKIDITKTLILATLLSGIIGIFYVLFLNVLRKN